MFLNSWINIKIYETLIIQIVFSTFDKYAFLAFVNYSIERLIFATKIGTVFRISFSKIV